MSQLAQFQNGVTLKPINSWQLAQIAWPVNTEQTDLRRLVWLCQGLFSHQRRAFLPVDKPAQLAYIDDIKSVLEKEKAIAEGNRFESHSDVF